MTITALYFWPWEFTLDSESPKTSTSETPKAVKLKKTKTSPAKELELLELPSIFAAPQAVTK